jgi:hypothetical protein
MCSRLIRRQTDGGHARGEASRVGPGRSVRASIAIALLIPHLTGCFQYVPANPSVIPNGGQVTVSITDRGRVALTEPVGPGVRRLEGNLVQSTDTSLVLSVTTVEYLDLGVPVKWRGERVEVSRDYVAEVQERRLSRSRTWIMTGLVVVGVALTTLITITGAGSETGGNRPPGDGDPD